MKYLFLILYFISFSPINNAMENELPQSQKNTFDDEILPGNILYIHGTGNMNPLLDPWMMNNKKILEMTIAQQSKERKRIAGLSFKNDTIFGLYNINEICLPMMIF